MRGLILLCGTLISTATIFLVSDEPDSAPVPGNTPVRDEQPADKDVPKKGKPLNDFMRRKLHASNQILEGLVTDRMSIVESGAKLLLEMSDAEQWRASNDALYLQFSRTFRDSVETLIDKAERKSIDGVALAWMDVTMNCIQCHEWVRNVMVADLDAPIPTLDRKEHSE